MKTKIILSLLTMFLFLAADAKRHNSSVNSKAANEKFRARIYFSTEVPTNGVAKESKEFFIDPVNGSFVYVVIDNYPTAFNFKQLKLKVFKTQNLQNTAVEEKTYNIDGSLYYTYIKYSFFKEGDYTFDVYSTGGEFVGSGSVSVKNKNGSTTTSTSTSTSTDLYAKAKVYCSTEMPSSSGVAKEVKSFDIKSGGGYVWVIVDNYPTNFNVRSLKLYVHKKDGTEYVKKDEMTYNISSGYYYTYFKYTFTDAGDYKLIVYDENNKYINTGYVTVNWARN